MKVSDMLLGPWDDRWEGIGILALTLAVPAIFAAALLADAFRNLTAEADEPAPASAPVLCPADTPEEDEWAFTQLFDALEEAAIEDAFDKWAAEH